MDDSPFAEWPDGRVSEMGDDKLNAFTRKIKALIR